VLGTVGILIDIDLQIFRIFQRLC